MLGAALLVRSQTCTLLPGASDVTVLMVVGAGRGPLVRASLAAADAAGRPLRVYAVEKNANAVVTLQNLVQSEGCAALGKAPSFQCLASLCVLEHFRHAMSVGAYSFAVIREANYASA